MKMSTGTVGALLGLTVLFIAGCADIRVMKTTDDAYPRKYYTTVQLVFSGEPQRPYKAIGRISVSKFRSFPPGLPRTGETLQRILRKQAGVLGGDAVINIIEDFASVSGVVIVYTDGAAIGNAKDAGSPAEQSKQ